MKKMVFIQIGLAIIAFVGTAWIFFKERPRAAENQQLRQDLSHAQQENQQLKNAARPVPYDLKQSRTYLHEGRILFQKQQYEQAIAMYDKALKSDPDDPYGWELKGYALYRAGQIPESIEANNR